MVADGLRVVGIAPQRVDQLRDVLNRLAESLNALDDSQVLAALLELLVSAEHATGLAEDIVHDLLTIYRDAMATGLAAGAPVLAMERLHAMFGQYARVTKVVAIRHLPLGHRPDWELRGRYHGST